MSDQAGVAHLQDTALVNAWGVAFSATSPFWISDNGTGVSTLYRVDPSTNAVTKVEPGGVPAVNIPLPTGSTDPNSHPTGLVFNGTGQFTVTSGGKTGSAVFIFDTEEGTISGWNPSVNIASAILAVDNSAAGAVYKGLAMAQMGTGNFLYATNFHAGTVDVFDSSFNPVTMPSGSFTDRKIPAGFAPFGIQNLGGKLYVSYAKQDADKHDDVAGRGNGFVDVFNTDGTLAQRLIRRGALDSPWGMTIAPSSFGRFGGDLLVGNFGNGRINAYDPNTGEFRGQLRTPDEKPVVIDGLWNISFGSGGGAGSKDLLFFTAGPNDESHGLFGSLQAVPSAKDGD